MSFRHGSPPDRRTMGGSSVGKHSRVKYAIACALRLGGDYSQPGLTFDRGHTRQWPNCARETAKRLRMRYTTTKLGGMGRECSVSLGAETRRDKDGEVAMRVFISKDNIQPGNEWFLHRNRPLTPEMVTADFEALHRAIDHSYGGERPTPEREEKSLRNWVGKVVQSHVDL